MPPPTTGPGIPVPTSLVASYQKDLSRNILIPTFAAIRGRLRQAESTYTAYRQVFRDIEKDPAVIKAFAGGGPAAAKMQAAKLHAYHKTQWEAKMKRFIGVSLIPGDEIGKTLIDGFIDNNVALIKTVQPKLLAKLTSDLQKLASTKPFDEQAIGQLLAKNYGSSGYNLRRIARDQTNKLIGQFTEKRQLSAGVEEYQWSTSGDERVRPTHRDNEGLIFRWDQPPSATGHPGHDIQCRCVAIPIIPKPKPRKRPAVGPVSTGPRVPLAPLPPAAPARPKFTLPSARGEFSQELGDELFYARIEVDRLLKEMELTDIQSIWLRRYRERLHDLRERLFQVRDGKFDPALLKPPPVPVWKGFRAPGPKIVKAKAGVKPKPTPTPKPEPKPPPPPRPKPPEGTHFFPTEQLDVTDDFLAALEKVADEAMVLSQRTELTQQQYNWYVRYSTRIRELKRRMIEYREGKLDLAEIGKYPPVPRIKGIKTPEVRFSKKPGTTAPAPGTELPVGTPRKEVPGGVRLPGDPELEQYREFMRLSPEDQERIRGAIKLRIQKIEALSKDLKNVPEKDAVFWREITGETKLTYTKFGGGRAGNYTLDELDEIMENVNEMLPERIKRMVADAGMDITFRPITERRNVLGFAQWWRPTDVVHRWGHGRTKPGIVLDSRKVRYANSSVEKTVVHEILHALDSVNDRGGFAELWKPSQIGTYGSKLWENVRKEIAFRKVIFRKNTGSRRITEWDWTFRSYEGFTRILGPENMSPEYITVLGENYFAAKHVERLLDRVAAGGAPLNARETRLINNVYGRGSDIGFDRAREGVNKVLRRMEEQAPQINKLFEYLHSSSRGPMPDYVIPQARGVRRVSIARRKFEEALESVQGKRPNPQYLTQRDVGKLYGKLLEAEAEYMLPTAKYKSAVQRAREATEAASKKAAKPKTGTRVTEAAAEREAAESAQKAAEAKAREAGVQLAAKRKASEAARTEADALSKASKAASSRQAETARARASQKQVTDKAKREATKADKALETAKAEAKAAEAKARESRKLGAKLEREEATLKRSLKPSKQGLPARVGTHRTVPPERTGFDMDPYRFDYRQHQAITGYVDRYSLPSTAEEYFGSGYDALNKATREGRRLTGRLKRMDDQLQESMRAMGTDRLVWRGEHYYRGSDWYEELKAMKAGDQLPVKQYMSTSTNIDTSASGYFGDLAGRSQTVMFQIRMRKSAKTIITNSGEREILLSRHAKLRVMSDAKIKKIDGHDALVIDVEVADEAISAKLARLEAVRDEAAKLPETIRLADEAAENAKAALGRAREAARKGRAEANAATRRLDDFDRRLAKESEESRAALRRASEARDKAEQADSARLTAERAARAAEGEAGAATRLADAARKAEVDAAKKGGDLPVGEAEVARARKAVDDAEDAAKRASQSADEAAVKAERLRVEAEELAKAGDDALPARLRKLRAKADQAESAARKAKEDLAAYRVELQAAKKVEKEAREALAKGGAAKAKADPVLARDPMKFDPEKWTRTGPQAGSNPGGKFKDPDGTEWYVKLMGDSKERVANEVLAADLYRAAGIDVADVRIVKYGNRGEYWGVASRIQTVQKQTASQLKNLQGVKEGFAVDAWLANWDVVGLEYDNLLKAGGKALRLDTGGALTYRAQGGLKGAAFGDTVGELDTFLHSWTNRSSAAVFGDITESGIMASAKRVASVSDEEIRRITALRLTPAKAREMADKLIARKRYILNKYPRARGALAEEARAAAQRAADEAKELLGIAERKVRYQTSDLADLQAEARKATGAAKREIETAVNTAKGKADEARNSADFAAGVAGEAEAKLRAAIRLEERVAKRSGVTPPVRKVPEPKPIKVPKPKPAPTPTPTPKPSPRPIGASKKPPAGRHYAPTEPGDATEALMSELSEVIRKAGELAKLPNITQQQSGWYARYQGRLIAYRQRLQEFRDGDITLEELGKYPIIPRVTGIKTPAIRFTPKPIGNVIPDAIAFALNEAVLELGELLVTEHYA